jgi:uncharacterized membrane protein
MMKKDDLIIFLIGLLLMAAIVITIIFGGGKSMHGVGLFIGAKVQQISALNTIRLDLGQRHALPGKV